MENLSLEPRSVGILELLLCVPCAVSLTNHHFFTTGSGKLFRGTDMADGPAAQFCLGSVETALTAWKLVSMAVFQ